MLLLYNYENQKSLQPDSPFLVFKWVCLRCEVRKDYAMFTLQQGHSHCSKDSSLTGQLRRQSLWYPLRQSWQKTIVPNFLHSYDRSYISQQNKNKKYYTDIRQVCFYTTVNVIRFAIRFAICNSILSCVCIKLSLRLSLWCLHQVLIKFKSMDKINDFFLIKKTHHIQSTFFPFDTAVKEDEKKMKSGYCLSLLNSRNPFCF